MPLEDVIAANLHQLFPGMDVVEHHTFRVTRNADLEINDGAADLMEALEEELSRKRFSPAVRLEVESSMPEHVLELLMSELELSERRRPHSSPARSTSRDCGRFTRSTGRTSRTLRSSPSPIRTWP